MVKGNSWYDITKNELISSSLPRLEITNFFSNIEAGNKVMYLMAILLVIDGNNWHRRHRVLLYSQNSSNWLDDAGDYGLYINKWCYLGDNYVALLLQR